MNIETRTIQLYRTSPHPCSYFQDRQATTVFVDPALKINQALNSELSDKGFRRSGAHIYRPDCQECKACISCRVPVKCFKPGRQFRKIYNRNQDLLVVEVDDLYCDEAYQLYSQYINTRHADGDMFPATEEQYQAFITTKTESTRFFKFYLRQSLVGVSIVDFLKLGLSAVYTFFDPVLEKRSLGKFMILWQITKTQDLNLPYVYLGYWIKDCQKMRYKSLFRPLEMLVNGKWVLLT